MNARERRLLDEHIARGRYRKEYVPVRCTELQTTADAEGELVRGCGWTGRGQVHSEFGGSWVTPEDCPNCGGEVEEAE